MFSAQFFKVLNDVWSNKTRTLLIVLSIAAGLTAVGTVISARILLSEGINQSYGSVNYANGSLTTVQAFDKDFVRSFNNVAGVAETDARRTLSARALNPKNQYHSIFIFSLLDYKDNRVNKVASTGGQWPPNRHQILIDHASLILLDVQVGETIQIETASGAWRSLEIVGVVNELSQPPATLSGAAYSYVDQETLEWLGAPSGFNQLYFTVKPVVNSTDEKKKILEKVVAKAETAGYTVVTNVLIQELPINSIIQTLLYILSAIGVLCLFLSIFLIVNTISAMVTQQTRQIGIMKAIGARAVQILWMYLFVVMFFGLLALAISIPLSAVGAVLLSQYLGNSFNFKISGNPIQIISVVIQIAIAFLVPTLASLVPLINGLRISATQALSSAGTNQTNYSSNLIDRLLSGANVWFTRYILVRSWILAVRNMFRQKIRLSLTLITLVVAGAVFITIFNVRETIFKTTDQLMRMQSYDLQVNFREQYRIDEVQYELNKIPGIKDMDTWLRTGTTRIRLDGSESDNISLTGVRPDSKVIVAPEMLEGRWLEPNDANAVVISSAIAQREPDLKVGQMITLKIDDRNYTLQIVGKALAVGAGPGESGAAYVNYSYLASVIRNPSKSNVTMITVLPNTGIPLAELKGTLDSHLKTNGFHVASIQTTKEQSENIRNNFASILTLLLLMSLLLAVVGGLGLMGTMSINVLERTREIGVLRAIGSSNRGVNWVFMIEGVSIGLASCLISIPFSLPLTSLTTTTIGNLMLGSPMSGIFAINGVIIWIVIVFILSLMANYFPARNAERLTVREVLAYE